MAIFVVNNTSTGHCLNLVLGQTFNSRKSYHPNFMWCYEWVLNKSSVDGGDLRSGTVNVTMQGVAENG